MKFLSNIKMRNKLLLILVPPCVLFIVFALFVIMALASDVKTITWNLKISSAILPFQEINEAVLHEEFVTVNHLYGDEKEQLEEARLETDNAIISFKKAVEALEHDSLAFVAIYEERILNQLNQLSTIRRKVDTKAIDSMAVDVFFGGIQANCLAAIDGIDKLYIVHPIFTRPERAFVALLHEKFSFQRQNVLIEKAIINDIITVEDFAKLSRYEEAEKVYQSIFESLASPEQLTLYSDTVSGPSITQVQEIIVTIDKLNIAGGFNLKVDTWAFAEDHKNALLKKVVTRMEENLKERAKAALRVDVIELILVVVVSLLILVLIAILGWQTSKDILRPLLSLQAFSQELEKKNLSNLMRASGRKDELGGLEGSFESLGNNLLKIVSNLKNETDSITHSSSEIVNTITELSTGQKETDNAVIETTATMEELRQTSELSSQKTKEVLDLTNQTLETLKLSTEATNNTIGDLNQIQEKMGTISDSTTKLNEHCQAIGTIIDSVHDLAEQSHVLAVNASIEAAKAGEQGKGFAVVAQEVRNLAEQSKQATSQVHNILTDIQNSMNTTVLATEQGSIAVKKGVEESHNTTEVMGNLANGVNTVIHATQEISSSSQQQAAAVGQTTEAISNIKQASAQQTDQIHMIEQNITNLHKISEALKYLIQEFVLPNQVTNGENQPSQEKPSQEGPNDQQR